MNRKWRKIVISILFVSGLSLLLYPLVANQWNSYRQSRLINRYQEEITSGEETGKIDYQAEWDRADAYNQALLPAILPDSFAIAETESEEDREYLHCLNLADNGIMGIVEIPKINVELPIFHTTQESVLKNGAGHLEGSSLPIGGGSTHTVISAHRGLPSAALFTDLDKLKEEDYFLFHILDDTLCYQVDQIEVVKPEETESLSVEEGKDYATLLTCTPYGVNSHRLLVRGHRVEYEPEVLEKASSGKVSSIHTNYLLWVLAGLGVTAAATVGLAYREKKRRMRRRHKKHTKGRNIDK